MKKIMALAATVMLAVAANAAAVGWNIAGAAAYKGGAYDIFVIGLNGVTGTEQIAALVAAGTDVSSYAFYQGGTVSNTGLATLTAANSGKSITYSGSGIDSYTAFAVLWTSDAKEASYTSTASITMDNDSTSKGFAFGNQSGNLSANKFTISSDAVPEPTSGLLMLLGMAGLALRRKHA